jgi:SET domain-containing protein
MILKKKILNQLQNNPVVKVVPSSIVGAGVGVIALTSIDKNEIVFAPNNNHFILWQEVSLCGKEVLNHIKNVCNSDEFGFWIDCELNKINASYFVNHSDFPNLYHDLNRDIYYAIKNIKIGEELTCKYLPEEMNWV